VIGTGDIRTLEEAQPMFNCTGCAGIAMAAAPCSIRDLRQL